MSALLALLTALGPDGTPPDNGPPPPGSSDVRPALDDPVAQSMRPDAPPIETVRVGPTRDFTTVFDALRYARNVQASALAAAGKAIPADRSSPAMGLLRDYRVDIIIDPGTYPEPVSGGGVPISAHFALYAADGQARSVTIRAGAAYSDGWTYHEGIVYDPRGRTGAKYGAHLGGYGTTIFSRGGMYHSAATAGSSWAMGMDGYGNGWTYCYDWDFNHASAGGRTNNHAASSITTIPEQMIYINCRSNGGLEFNPMGSSGHTMWAVDCEADWVGIEPAGTNTLITDGNVQALTNPQRYRHTPDQTRRDWPVPVGGLSPYWRARLGL